MNDDFITPLLAWFSQEAADLPWRNTRDPYRIWLSEIMLQQTQVSTVIPYYERFLETYPTVHDLAAASQDELLKQWEGLGYYSRARNLHTAAKQIVSEYNGQLPTNADELQRLKGIGRYTAGAIASIAFGEAVPVLDGNVIRVFTRLFDIADDVRQQNTQKHLWQIAEELIKAVPEGRAGDYNQALMELGRTICKPQNPLCERCPIAEHCFALKNNVQNERPIKTKKPPTPHYDVTCGLIWNEDGQLLITKRRDDALLGGLWEFPGGKIEEGETLEACLARELREELGIKVEVGTLYMRVKHAYTHFKITLHAFNCHLMANSPPPSCHDCQAFQWVSVSELSDYAFSRADRYIIEDLQNRQYRLL